jgi:hypothetical protein
MQYKAELEHCCKEKGIKVNKISEKKDKSKAIALQKSSHKQG